MTPITPGELVNLGPWQRYTARERAARSAYLATVEKAHREYLTGPWPDRDAYQVVERQAWVTYYAAGRDAWRYYAAEITEPPAQSPRLSRNPATSPLTGTVSATRPGPGPQPAYHPYPEGDH